MKALQSSVPGSSGKNVGRPLVFRLRSLAPSVLAVVVILIAQSYATAQDSVQTLTLTRAAVTGSTASLPLTEKFIVTPAPSTVKGVLILLTGGNGELGLSTTPFNALAINQNNFLVRSRWLFASEGFEVLTLGLASDFLSLPNGLTGYFGSSQHISDVAEVIAWARTQNPGVPVWLVGTSNGTIGGVFVAASLSPSQGGPDGLVLTSPITNNPADGSVFSASLGSIVVPTLILSNIQDGCSYCPPLNDFELREALIGAPIATVLFVAGGNTPLTDACDALSFHGYFGIEPIVVSIITDWINHHRNFRYR
jgi:hypothetical protein